MKTLKFVLVSVSLTRLARRVLKVLSALTPDHTSAADDDDLHAPRNISNGVCRIWNGKHRLHRHPGDTIDLDEDSSLLACCGSDL